MKSSYGPQLEEAIIAVAGLWGESSKAIPCDKHRRRNRDSQVCLSMKIYSSKRARCGGGIDHMVDY